MQPKLIECIVIVSNRMVYGELRSFLEMTLNWCCILCYEEKRNAFSVVNEINSIQVFTLRGGCLLLSLYKFHMLTITEHQHLSFHFFVCLIHTLELAHCRVKPKHCITLNVCFEELVRGLSCLRILLKTFNVSVK